MFFRRKNKCTIWRLDKEKLLPDCVEQSNTGDGGKLGIWCGISGFGTTRAKIYSDNMNGNSYCDVLQNQLKQCIAEIPPKKQNYLPARPGTVAYFEHRQGPNSQNEAQSSRLGSEEPRSQSHRNVVVHSRQRVGIETDLLKSRAKETSRRRVDRG